MRQDIFINTYKHTFVLTVALRNIAGVFLYALIEFCPGCAWYQFELLCVRHDCSQC